MSNSKSEVFAYLRWNRAAIASHVNQTIHAGENWKYVTVDPNGDVFVWTNLPERGNATYREWLPPHVCYQTSIGGLSISPLSWQDCIWDFDQIMSDKVFPGEPSPNDFREFIRENVRVGHGSYGHPVLELREEDGSWSRLVN